MLCLLYTELSLGLVDLTGVTFCKIIFLCSWTSGSRHLNLKTWNLFDSDRVLPSAHFFKRATNWPLFCSRSHRKEVHEHDLATRMGNQLSRLRGCLQTGAWHDLVIFKASIHKVLVAKNHLGSSHVAMNGIWVVFNVFTKAIVVNKDVAASCIQKNRRKPVFLEFQVLGANTIMEP